MKKFKLSTIVFFILFCYCCYSQKTGTVLSTDNSPIYYKTFGSGKPLLIINGGPGMNSDGFENLAIKLSENYQAILYDQRGTGKSKLNLLDTSTITIKLMVGDIESLRKHLKIEKWSILGHSFGGMLASYYATQHPEKIDKIILSSSGGIDLVLLNYVQASINSKLSKNDLDSVNYWTKKINDGDTSHYAKLERGKHLAPAYVIDKKYLPVIAERLTQGNTTINQLIWSDLQKINFDCSEKLKTFNKPVLIIQGKQDIIKPEIAEKAHKVLVNSKVIFVEHSIHYAWLDNPEVYFKELNSFLVSAN
ncbi:MAG: alpha/beta fold hydrolase [Bacteroidota bacterium]